MLAHGDPTKLESKFLDQQVDVLVNLKAMKIVGISLQPHEQPTVRSIRRSNVPTQNTCYINGHTFEASN